MFVDIPNHLATWLILFIFFALASRGLGTLGEVLRSTGMFLLEKALGPAIDFAEGKPGSAARTWIVLSLVMALRRRLFHIPRNLGWS